MNAEFKNKDFFQDNNIEVKMMIDKKIKEKASKIPSLSKKLTKSYFLYILFVFFFIALNLLTLAILMHTNILVFNFVSMLIFFIVGGVFLLLSISLMITRILLKKKYINFLWFNFDDEITAILKKTFSDQEVSLSVNNKMDKLDEIKKDLTNDNVKSSSLFEIKNTEITLEFQSFIETSNSSLDEINSLMIKISKHENLRRDFLFKYSMFKKIFNNDSDMQLQAFMDSDFENNFQIYSNNNFKIKAMFNENKIDLISKFYESIKNEKFAWDHRNEETYVYFDNEETKDFQFAHLSIYEKSEKLAEQIYSQIVGSVFKIYKIYYLFNLIENRI